MFGLFKASHIRGKTLDDVRAEVIRRHDEIGSEIAVRFSRGNVAIQEGAFLMEVDLLSKKNHPKFKK